MAAQGVAPPAAAGTPAEPAEDSQPARRRWVLPPLRLNGSLTYDGRFTRGDGEPASSAHLLSATTSTETYIYQPWFATVAASLGLTTSWTRTGAANGGGPDDLSQLHENVRTTERFITGDVRLDVFPRSRFPAEVHFGRADSRTDSGLASGIAYTRTNFGLSQQYRPESGAYSVSGSYNHYDQDGIGFRSRQDALGTEFSTGWKNQNLGLAASHSRASSETQSDESRFTSLVARHSYTPSRVLSIDSTGNFTRSEERGDVGSDLNVLQLSSVGVYQPKDAPWTMSGNLRGTVLRDRETGADADSLGGSVGSSYTVNNNLRLSATAGASMARNSAGSNHALVLGLGANYSGDPIVFRNINYNWFAGANANGALGNSDSSGRISEAGLGLQLGHGASRLWPVGQNTSFTVSAGQSLGANIARSSGQREDGTRDPQVNMVNNVAATWQRGGEGTTAYARLSFSDSRDVSGGGSQFQLLNAQVSGTWDMQGGRSLTGDLTYQVTQQRTESSFGPGDEVLREKSRASGASGEITFNQNQLFGVPRLRFSSRLRLAQDVLKQPGQALSIADRETRLWENRLDWNIGRLDTQLTLRVSEVDNRRVNSLWIRIRRVFSN